MTQYGKSALLSAANVSKQIISLAPTPDNSTRVHTSWSSSETAQPNAVYKNMSGEFHGLSVYCTGEMRIVSETQCVFNSQSLASGISGRK